MSELDVIKMQKSLQAPLLHQKQIQEQQQQQQQQQGKANFQAQRQSTDL